MARRSHSRPRFVFFLSFSFCHFFSLCHSRAESAQRRIPIFSSSFCHFPCVILERSLRSEESRSFFCPSFSVIPTAANNPDPFLRLSTQVPPRRVFRFNEFNLFRPQQALDLFLGGDCRGDVVGLLKIDETVDPVALCESRYRASLVFIHTPLEVIGYAGVERSRRAAHYIDEVALAARWFPHTATGSGILRFAPE